MSGRLKVWNVATAAWEYTAGNPSAVTVQTAAPSSPNNGDLWYDTDDLSTDDHYDHALLVPKSLFTTKGDIAVATAASTVVRQGVGVNGTHALADSNQTNGVLYVGPAYNKAPWNNDNNGGIHTPATVACFASAAQSAATAQIPTWYPFWFPRRSTPKIYVNCTTLEAGSTIRMSTWTNNEATMRPSVLSEDAGTVSGASTGAKSITVATPVGPGWVWIGLWCSNHTTVRWYCVTSSNASHMGNSPLGADGVGGGKVAFGWVGASVDYSAAWSSTVPTLTIAANSFNPNAVLPFVGI